MEIVDEEQRFNSGTAVLNEQSIKTYCLFINGKDVDSGKYEYFPYSEKAIVDYKTAYRIVACLKKGIYHPEADEYIYAKYCVADDDMNKQAIQAAYDAGKKFKYFPINVRRKILDDIHKNLLEKKEELLNLFVIEGHPRKLAEWEFSGMEKAYRSESLDFFRDELWSRINAKNEEIYLVRKPDGVVCVSPPKNASCSNSLTAGFALLGGNTIVLKPPLRMPLATIYLWREIVWKAAKDNGAPDGTINIILGNSKKITDEWLESPLVNDVIYFGNSEKGLEIGKQIYLAGKKPILELSGNDIMFVWKDADIGGAVNSLLDAFLGSTQICMVPKTAVIHSDIYKDFLDALVCEVKKLKVGLPSDPQTCLTPVMMIKEFYEFLEDALDKGAILACGGERVDHRGENAKDGIFINPSVLSIEDDCKALDMKIVKEENFFPLLPLVKMSGISDEDIFNKMVSMSNSNEYGLRTSLWIKSDLYTDKFMQAVNNSGLFRINSRHVDFSLYLSTHGGTGKTGGPCGEMNYVWQKTTHLQGISLMRERTSVAK